MPPGPRADEPPLPVVACVGAVVLDEEGCGLGVKPSWTVAPGPLADKATVEACAKCHNEHADSPRKDWKVGDTMGALVIRIPKG